MIYDILKALYFIGTIWGLWLVFKKAGIAPWKSLVPVYNIVVWLKMCNRKWSWYLWFLVPGINIFMFLLMVQETARDFRRYNFWEQLLAVIFPWAYLPWLGLSKGTAYHDPKKDPPKKVTEGRDWLDAIAFAIVAAVIIRGNVFELYGIPSSSMEKSLLVGDHLLVSKVAYGPRVTMTPLALPLIHNTIPGTGDRVESYLRWPQLPYHRYPGYTKVKRFDAVVFNFPEGDTTLNASPTNLVTYYDAVNGGLELRYMLNQGYRVRPVDKRQNYIKRCIGMPGDDLQIIDRQVYINGEPLQLPKDAQFKYYPIFTPGTNYMRMLDNYGVSQEDIHRYMSDEGLPLTTAQYMKMAKSDHIVSLEPYAHENISQGIRMFPHMANNTWSANNYGPVHIPAKGEVLTLNDSTLPFYRRLITTYEGNTLEVKDGKIFINGEQTETYTCRQNYYWMMGDNRHCSQDSRYWGYVPEDHISGKARWILWSWDKDHKKMRWNRIFKNACDY